MEIKGMGFKLFGRGLLILFIIPLIILFFLSLMSIGLNGELQFEIILIDMAVIAYFLLGLYLELRGNIGFNKLGILTASILLLIGSIFISLSVPSRFLFFLPLIPVILIVKIIKESRK